MPAADKLQAAAAGQAAALDTTRVQSTIPKGDGSGANWEYPSPQMFWNAMVRKNKSDGSAEEDMDMVVAIHNNMNETTWTDVLAWEALHATAPQAAGAGSDHGGGGSPSDPKSALEAARASTTLARFTGRPDENSPKSLLKQWLFGCPAPFDRHDWVVSRGSKAEVRYVIDYYHDDAGVDGDGSPSLHDTQSIRSIRVDVRPALDSPQALWDRAVRMPLASFLAPGLTTSPFRHLPLNAPRNAPSAARFGPGPAAVRAAASKQAAAGRAVIEAEAIPGADLRAVGERLGKACAPCKQRLTSCEGEQDCSNASVALTYCMAQVLCEKDAAVFGAALEAGAGEAKLEDAFGAMTACIGSFEERAARQVKQHRAQLAK